MNTKSLTNALALSALALLTSNALADAPRPSLPNPPSSSTSSASTRVHVPRSSHNGVPIDYSVDPQYHTASFRTVTRGKQSAGEPDRIFDSMKKMFVSNPAYHEPSPAKQAVQTRSASYEPRRIYDLEKQQFIDNPDYRDPQAQGAASKPVTHRLVKRAGNRQSAA